MSLLIGLDPGTTQSALVVLDGTRVVEAMTEANSVILHRLRCPKFDAILVIEDVACYGMAVGREVFATVKFIGRCEEAWYPRTFYELERRAIKVHLCCSMRAKDANIRAALLDRYGGSAAKGTKRQPGPLYGVKAHEFAALAVAITWLETHKEQHDERPSLGK